MQTRQAHFEAHLDVDKLRDLQAIQPHVVFVFGSPDFLTGEALFQPLRQAFPQACLLGCSTAGEIAGRSVYQNSCVVTALHFDGDIRLRVAEADIPSMEASQPAGETLGRQLAAPDLKAVLVFGQGIGVNGSALIEGMASQIGRLVPITGGLAGDNGAFVRTRTLTPNGISEKTTVALGLYGDSLIIGYGSYGGWTAFGPARKVTRSEGNVLYELDGEPALNIYKRYLGDYAKDLPASGLLFPFEMLDEDHDALGLIRTILGIDEAEGSLILAGDIVQNGYLRLMHASTGELVDGADEAAIRTRAHLPEGGAPASGLAILVSCVGRRLVMGDQVEDEVHAVADVLGSRVTLTGFYSYGEISPLSATTDCKLHNQTMTITYLDEQPN